MKVLSINVGQPKEVAYQQKIITTGIFKKPVSGLVKVNQLNLEGDQQADLSVHGGIDKAVYAYPTEHYAFWRQQFPQWEFEFAVFGENLSVSGLLETEVCIGDTFKIGTAEVMVTSPRMPCFKLGIKMGDPRFVKSFLQANLNGFYLKVTTEGEFEAGQDITPIGNDDYGLTVQEVARLYSTERENRSLLQKAVGAPNLPSDWKEYFEKRLVKLS